MRTSAIETHNAQLNAETFLITPPCPRAALPTAALTRAALPTLPPNRTPLTVTNTQPIDIHNIFIIMFPTERHADVRIEEHFVTVRQVLNLR